MKATGEVMAIDRTFECGVPEGHPLPREITGRSLLWEDDDWVEDGKLYEDRLPLHPNDERLWGTPGGAAARPRAGGPVAANGDRPLVHPRVGQHRADGGAAARRAPCRPASCGMRNGWGFRTPRSRCSPTVRRSRYVVCGARVGHPAGLQDGGHLRRRVRGGDGATFYSAYEEENEAPPLGGQRALVAGSGPIRIGQGIEFDYCSVHAAWALQGEGVKSIVVNSNPETVSTDFDTSDRLYFEPLERGERARRPGKRGGRGGRRAFLPALDRAVRRTDRDQPVAGARPRAASDPGLDGALHRHRVRPAPLRGVFSPVSASRTRRARR